MEATDVWAKELADAEYKNAHNAAEMRAAKVARDATGPGNGTMRRDDTGDVSAPVPKKAPRYA